MISSKKYVFFMLTYSYADSYYCENHPMSVEKIISFALATWAHSSCPPFHISNIYRKTRQRASMRVNPFLKR
jgi:hypothetical protein